MSTLKTDAIEAATGTNTDLSLDGKGTGVPDLAAGFKVGSVAGVPTASIRDDAVTLAKLAAGTDGELITWDASGDPAAVAVGTATHVLTSNGAGAAPTFQAAAGGGAWNIISTQVASNSATLDITGLDSTYDIYAFGISDLVPETDNRNIYIRLGDSSGFDSGASDYAWTNFQNTSGDATVSGTKDASSSHIRLNLDVGTATGEGTGAIGFLLQPGDATTFPVLTYDQTGTKADATCQQMRGVGRRNAVITVDRIQILMDTGNIVSGRFTVWGIAHA